MSLQEFHSVCFSSEAVQSYLFCLLCHLSAYIIALIYFFLSLNFSFF